MLLRTWPDGRLSGQAPWLECCLQANALIDMFLANGRPSGTFNPIPAPLPVLSELPVRVAKKGRMFTAFSEIVCPFKCIQRQCSLLVALTLGSWLRDTAFPKTLWPFGYRIPTARQSPRTASWCRTVVPARGYFSGPPCFPHSRDSESPLSSLALNHDLHAGTTRPHQG